MEQISLFLILHYIQNFVRDFKTEKKLVEIYREYFKKTLNSLLQKIHQRCIKRGNELLL